MSISPCYSHLVVKNGNFTLLLTYSGQEMLLTPSVQEWQISHSYLTSSGQEWLFKISTDI